MVSVWAADITPLLIEETYQVSSISNGVISAAQTLTIFPLLFYYTILV